MRKPLSRPRALALMVDYWPAYVADFHKRGRRARKLKLEKPRRVPFRLIVDYLRTQARSRAMLRAMRALER